MGVREEPYREEDGTLALALTRRSRSKRPERRRWNISGLLGWEGSLRSPVSGSDSPAGCGEGLSTSPGQMEARRPIRGAMEVVPRQLCVPTSRQQTGQQRHHPRCYGLPGSYLVFPIHNGPADPPADLGHYALEHRSGLQGGQPGGRPNHSRSG